MGLFDRQESGNLEKAKPLAARMRPQSLDEFVGQSHFLGEGKLLRRILAADRIGSLIFYGSPGTGKTSLAELIARGAEVHGSHRVFIQHRLGFVAAEEPSIVIRVQTKHSAAAFDVCRWYLKEIKTSVPIWKNPVWSETDH